ncbi:hypothetical protein [Tianweitania sediminis]|uniref:Uncharacterized protein n=1 Tax=Tianweitania sediminis TaxID=1502156 RepID=A0A8J7UKP8_9HYPH|nr:hypothetical protein [Tianweitania sediminis]MBP0439904.1 hypothetical protein [Tianweitania sediminis]
MSVIDFASERRCASAAALRRLAASASCSSQYAATMRMTRVARALARRDVDRLPRGDLIRESGTQRTAVHGIKLARPGGRAMPVLAEANLGAVS